MLKNTHDFLQAKQDGGKLSLATCYDYTFARLLSETPLDAILVGDSAAMVMHGHPSTLYATVEMMRAHTEAVVRGAPSKFVIADMPFLSFRKGIPAALDTARQLMTTGAQAVKLEGVEGHEDVIERLVQSGVPVMGHLGLQPQSVHAYGGYRVQGRSEDSAEAILRQAKTLEALGAFAVVLECIPGTLACEITSALRIPTIGIGAGPQCDGQILVLHDLLGLNRDFQPKFARRFLCGANAVLDALERFDHEVKAGTFPSHEETYA
ncbi:MAG TPA: 3-methyl-2-oxobutanoate hydroxymethyltransferase [Bryobacteraceae bacterium]|jgi:3-methyl-2-oxobutanoate hydroxymethyltransferase|nr:3-methyl-2-oxobutanoate hydroxymethyltransferase [Bryobacteraceae bacterium]